MNKTESVVVKGNNGSSSKVNFFKNPKVYPGDVITATSKPSKNDEESTRKFLDDFIRVFSIITGTLTTILITSKLYRVLNNLKKNNDKDNYEIDLNKLFKTLWKERKIFKK